MATEYHVDVMIRITHENTGMENLTVSQQFPFAARDFADIARVLGEFQQLADQISAGQSPNRDGRPVANPSPASPRPDSLPG